MTYGDVNIYVSKFNSSGVEQWTKTYTSPGTNNDAIYSAEILNDVIYINGVTAGTWPSQGMTSNNIDSLVLVLDTDGNQVSASQTGGSGGSYVSPSSLAVDSSGNYYQAGSISWSGTPNTLDGQTCSANTCNFIRKFNSSHVLQWTKLYPWATTQNKGGSIQLNAAEDRLYWVATTSEDGPINGKTNPLEPTTAVTIIVNSLLTSNGNFDWTQWLPYHTVSLAGQWGGGALAKDAPTISTFCITKAIPNQNIMVDKGKHKSQKSIQVE